MKTFYLFHEYDGGNTLYKLQTNMRFERVRDALATCVGFEEESDDATDDDMPPSQAENDYSVISKALSLNFNPDDENLTLLDGDDDFVTGTVSVYGDDA